MPTRRQRRESLVAEKKQEEPANQSKSLTDSDMCDDTEVNPRLKTSVEEREYNIIPGSATATQIALSHSRAQANPTIEHGPLQWKVKVRSHLQTKPKIKTLMPKTRARKENKL